tara:strand:+ start:4758 stop:5009 length:252 start_codon:yes stop_codon:yes gene_type:complete
MDNGGDRFGYGTEKRGLLEGGQVPFSQSLLNKNFSEDEQTYYQLIENYGQENINKLLEVFTKKYVSKNPDLKLKDFNEFVMKQ